MRLRFGKRPKNGADGSEWYEGQSRIQIGRFTYGERRLKIRQWDYAIHLTVGSFCSIADGVTVFLGGNHRNDWITTYPFGLIATDTFDGPSPDYAPRRPLDVSIGNDVWIGHDALIMPGVTVGDGAVIGAKSVVRRDVPPYAMVMGNPGEVIKLRFAEDVVEALLRLRWWELPVTDIKAIQAVLCAPPTRDIVEDLIAQYRSPA